MGRFKHLVNSDFDMKGFRVRYQILTDRREGEVVIPIIAFIEGGMTLPIGRITRDYLINHRLCPHQCAPNLFRVLGSVYAVNEQMNLGLT